MYVQRAVIVLANIYLFVWVFFNNNKNENKISRANLNKFLLREIKVFKCPNIVPPQVGKASITISLSRWAASSMLCLFVCFFSVPFYFFPNTHAEEKERDKNKWHKVHKTVKAEKQMLNRSLCSLLTSSKMLLSLSYVVFIELHKKLTSLKLYLNLQQIRHHLNEMKRNYNCLSIPFRLTGSKPLNNGSELKKSWAVSIIFIEDITRWWEDMNFMFEWHENIKFISSSQGVMFFLLYGD